MANDIKNYRQYIEWDVPLSQVQVGVTIGYEVELSIYYDFNPVMYYLNTFHETAPALSTFYYSLDDGATWIEFPQSGQEFTTAYKMRLKFNCGKSDFIFVVGNHGVIKQIRPDGYEIIQAFTISGITEFIDIGYNDNFLFLLSNNTLYRYTVNGKNIDPYLWSIDLQTNALATSVDYSRKTFWQIDRNIACLKDWHGETIGCVNLGVDIDFEFSSSSSTSSESSSSSSSIDSSSSSSSSSVLLSSSSSSQSSSSSSSSS